MVSHMVEVVQLNVWKLNVVAKYFSQGLCCSCSILFGYACSNILTYLLLFYSCCYATNLCDSC